MMRASPPGDDIPHWRHLVSKQIKAKQVRTKATAKKRASTPATVRADAARDAWLAGLGAVAVVQKQGRAAFEALVVEGRQLQVRGERIARALGEQARSGLDAGLKPVRQRFDGLRREASARIEHGVGRALSWAGVPSKADVDGLIKRIDTLSRQLRAAR
jgi:poly(hydroxyalkanoate) granule-associated protein